MRIVSPLNDRTERRPSLICSMRRLCSAAVLAGHTALPHLAVRVVGDDGSPVEPGAVGEICVAPATEGEWADEYRPMLGYWEQPEATAATLRDGVLHTGDLGTVDGDGNLHVRERKSLLIIRGGANVYPAEVERVLDGAPGVAASVVLGIPDERLGERVVAIVEPEPGAVPLDLEAVRAHCAEHLARYKVPDRIIVVDAFERSSMGKIVRRGLAALVEAPDTGDATR